MANWGALSKQIDDQLADDLATGTLAQEGGHRGSANTAIVAYLRQELDRHGEDELRRRMQCIKATSAFTLGATLPKSPFIQI